jgi:cytochrome c oxidase subunit I+III
VTAAFIFSYLFLWTARPALWPPDGAALPAALAPVIATLTAVGMWLLFRQAERWLRRDRPRWLVGSTLLLAAALAAGLLLALWVVQAGTAPDPSAGSYAASVGVLIGWAAMHVVIGLVMALWCVARLLAGMLNSWRCLTLRICTLFAGFTAATTVIVLILVAGFPYALR